MTFADFHDRPIGVIIFATLVALMGFVVLFVIRKVEGNQAGSKSRGLRILEALVVVGCFFLAIFINTSSRH